MTIFDEQHVFVRDSVTGTVNAVGGGEDLSLDATRTVTLDGTPYADAFDTRKFREFEVVIARPIEQQYRIDGDTYTFAKVEDELRAAAWSFDNAPHTLNHPETGIVRHTSQIRGFHKDPRYVENYDTDGDALITHLYVPTTDEEALEFIHDNEGVSIGFQNRLDWEVERDGVDAIQRDIVADHVASTDTGRCSLEDGCGVVEGLASTTNVTDGDAVVSGLSEMHALDGVAATLTESEHSDMNPTYSEGDWVSWEWSGGTAVGKVRNVSTSEALSSSGATRDPEEKGEPVYKIEHWDEESEEFGNMKVAYESNLSPATDPTTDTRCSAGPCSCGLHDAAETVEVNGTTIDMTVPDGAQSAAQAFLDAKKVEGLIPSDCGTGAGTTSAEMIASGTVTPDRLENDIAPYLNSHEGDVSTETHPTDWPTDPEADTPWTDCGDAQYAAWGWLSLLDWARTTADQLKKARGEETVYDSVAAFVDAKLPTDDEGTPYGVRPSENGDDEWKYRLADCNDVKDAYNLRNNGDYDIETSTLVARIKSAAEMHDCPPEQRPWADSSHRTDAPKQTQSESVRSSNRPRDDWRTEADSRSESVRVDSEDAMHQNDSTMSDSDTPTVAELTVDAIAEKNDEVAELRDEKAEMAEEKSELEDRVDVLEDTKEDLEDEVEALQDELKEYREAEKAELIEDITDLVDTWDAEELSEEDMDTLETRLEIAEDAVSSTPSTPDETTDATEDNTPSNTEPAEGDDLNVGMEHRTWG